MTQELTDKFYIVCLKGGYRIWINEEQSEKIKLALEKNQKFIYTEKGMFRADEVLFILPANEVEKQDRIKKGEWQCDHCKRWHPRFEECGCQGGKF
jgi:hypothetical protein